MKKILFVVKYPLEDTYTIKNKIDGQINAARAEGYESYYIGYDRKYSYLIGNDNKEIIKRNNLTWVPGYIHTIAFVDLFISVLKTIKKHRFSIFYMRSCPIDYIGKAMIMRMHKKGKLIVEIPTYPEEKEKFNSLLRKLYWDYSRHIWKNSWKYVDLFTLIGEESNNYHSYKAININNAVDVSIIKQRKKIEGDGKTHFLALASMSKWHGFDRIINGLAQLNPEIRKNIVLDMVGSEGDGSLGIWKQMSVDLCLTNNVIFHGYKSGKELDHLFDIADIGFCSLGLHRIGVYSASILKLREYTARGLPFVYATDDPGIHEDFPYALMVSSDDSAIDIEQVLVFLEKLKNDPDLITNIRQYAIDNMSWNSEFKKVFREIM